MLSIPVGCQFDRYQLEALVLETKLESKADTCRVVVNIKVTTNRFVIERKRQFFP